MNTRDAVSRILAGELGKGGSLTLSWGPWGGFYVVRGRRLCLGWIALTYIREAEIDELMAAWIEVQERR